MPTQRLFQADRITTYCPRCGTPLSDAEVATGYTEVEDPSVFILFRVTEPSHPALGGAAFQVIVLSIQPSDAVGA